MSGLRIAIAGFQHETNTFAPLMTNYEDFLSAGSWPGVTKGGEVLDVFVGLNIPIGGFIQAASDCKLIPILWSAAEPGGYVSSHAFETLTGAICSGLENAGDLDAVYLDLHGAMVVDGFEDGEGEVVRRVREIVGESVPIAVSLDLHGNLFPQFFALSDVVTIYRTYPHVDMAATGKRTYELLLQHIEHKKPLAKAFRHLDYLIPITSQSTMRNPASRLYQSLEETDSAGILSADIAMGFPPADIEYCGVSLVCYGKDQAACDRYTSQLHRQLSEIESEFEDPMISAAQAVEKAKHVALSASKPVIICDPQDNPGAGATGDSTGVLRALIDGYAQDAWVGMIWDPQAADAAHNAGTGGYFDTNLGGRYSDGLPENAPIAERFIVESISDGIFRFSGPMYGGATARLGKMALLKIDRSDCDVHVIVTSVRAQNADCEIFRSVGVEPADKKILVVKSAIHFLAAYEPIAQEIIFAAADGMNPCALDQISYRNLRHGVRLGPDGPVYTG